MDRVDVAIVGGGVTGLASALVLGERGLSVCVLERHARPGLECSTHNSGVIHAGIYNPPTTLKGRLAVEGRHALYRFCADHDVPHARCGKLIVIAQAADVGVLETLHRQGTANGVEGLEIVDRAFITEREPHVRAHAALFSPDTGIVDVESLVKALRRVAEARGAIVLTGTCLVGADRAASGMILETERERFEAGVVVNAAGLWADDVSRLLGGEAFTIFPCRGEYAELSPSARHLVKGLVYPLPHTNGHGLGVHLTRAVMGNVWLGPTARYQTRKDDYEGDRLALEAFLEAAREFIPALTLDDLRLAGSGIRPKLHAPDQAPADFLIRQDAANPFVVQAAGIESPGLTSCLAIGRLVADIVGSIA